MFGILSGLVKVTKAIVTIPVAAAVDLKDTLNGKTTGKSESEKNLDRMSKGASEIVDDLLERKK
jgi:hypothetical protein